MTSSAYEPDIQGGGGPAASVCEPQPVWVGTTGGAVNGTLKADLEGPLEAAFAAASKATGRFDHVITREQKVDRQALASAITIEDEASFAQAAAAYAEQNCSSPAGSAHLEPEPPVLDLPGQSFDQSGAAFQPGTAFQPGAWVGTLGHSANSEVQWETAPAIPSLAHQGETASSLRCLELENPVVAQTVDQFAQAVDQFAQPVGAKDTTGSIPDTAESEPTVTIPDPNAAAIALQAVPQSKRFATTGNLRKLESQKLRCMDDYEKPEDVCILQWLRTTTREWYAKESMKIITRLFGASDARLLPHLDSLAELQHRRRFIDDAERLHARALSIREQQFGRTHSGCATNLMGLARICHDQGRYLQAEELFREAIRLHENAFRKLTFMNDKGLVNTAEREQALIRFLDASNQLAQMLAEQGRFAEAEQEYELVLEAWNGFPAEASQSVHTVVAAVLENYRAVQIASNRASNRETESSGSGKQTLVLNYLT
ncbi:MAG: tetratricopeptide repeat protein [Candidatus Obscuribacterales bacterium]